LAKVDKSQLSKAEWKRLKEFRRRQKQKDKQQKQKLKTIADFRPNVVEQTPPVVDQPSKVAAQVAPDRSYTPRKIPKIAFVLGNGTSRAAINPEDLRPYGKIYGCNALYRSFDPDYLVSVDVKMVLELQKAGYQHKNPNVWTNPNKSLMKYKGFNFFNPSKGWSSGPTALWLASQHGYDEIYVLGFDYRGLDDGKKLNNVYADTPNYKKSSDSATFFGNWMRQTTSVIKENRKIHYKRVIVPDNYKPAELNNFENFSHILMQDFHNQFNLPSK